MLKYGVFGAVALFAFPGMVMAETAKMPSPYDYRVKNVVYHENDTIEIDGVAGLATQIVVGPDEDYVTHVFGDQGGWAFTHKLNHYFIRPKANFSDTNLSIVTSKHIYNLLLRYVGGEIVAQPDGTTVEKFATTPWALRQATVQVNYVYPNEEAKKRHDRAAKDRVKGELADPYGNGPKNLAYRMSDDPKSRSIAPNFVWDDYRFTYFMFPVNAELPTLFVQDSNGKESVVNAAVVGINHNILVAQMTSREWFVRYGDRVVGVVNDAYNPNYGAAPNGTISPRVRRVEAETGDDDE